METGTNNPNSRIQHLGFLIVFAIGLLLASLFACQSFCKTRPCVDTAIDSRINPNFASAASLARLPGVGVSIAGSIVEYRNDFALEGKNRRAFENPQDLDRVYGIGPAKIKSIEKFLTFDKKDNYGPMGNK